MHEGEEVLERVEDILQQAVYIDVIHQEGWETENLDGLEDYLPGRASPDYSEFQGRAALKCLDEIVEDFHDSRVGLWDYTQQLRRINLNPTGEEYVYATPLKDFKHGISQEASAYTSHTPWVPAPEDHPMEVLGLSEPEGVMDLLGLTFPYWGVGYERSCEPFTKKGEAITHMLFHFFDLVEEEGTEVIDDWEVYRLNGNFYQIERDRSLKGVYRFLGEDEEVAKFLRDVSGREVPLPEPYTEEKIKKDAEVFECLRDMHSTKRSFRSGNDWFSAMHELEGLEDEFDRDTAERSYARLRALGLVSELWEALVRDNWGEDCQAKMVEDVPTKVEERVKEIKRNGWTEKLEDAIYENRLSIQNF